MKKTLLTFLFMGFATISFAQDRQFSVAFETGLHSDISDLFHDKNEYLSWYPDEFEHLRIRFGWINRFAINYHTSEKWMYSLRIGYTNFRIDYSKTYRDVAMAYIGLKFVEKYFPVDLVVNRNIKIDEKNSLKIGLGVIVRVFRDSGFSYLTWEEDGILYASYPEVKSRQFPDMGFSMNINYSYKVNDTLSMGITANPYYLLYGYNVESIILSPTFTLNL